MMPLFTSRAEWRDIAPAGERAYVRGAVGWVARAGLVGVGVLVLGVGAADPYWRSLPILLVFAASLGAMSGLSALLFRREWRAMRTVYGDPIESPAAAPRPR